MALEFWKKNKCCEEVVGLLQQIVDTEKLILQTDQKILAALGSKPVPGPAVALKVVLGTPVNQ